MMISLLAKSLANDLQSLLGKADLNPSGNIAVLKENLAKHIAAALTKANIVSREEFDAQSQSLKRLSNQVKILEQQLIELEKQISSSQTEK